MPPPQLDSTFNAPHPQASNGDNRELGGKAHQEQ